MFVWNSAMAGGGEGSEHGRSDGAGGGLLARVCGWKILGQNAELVVLLDGFEVERRKDIRQSFLDGIWAHTEIGIREFQSSGVNIVF